MYQELIDDFILERDAVRQEERGSDAGEWHPSSISGECLRPAVYSFTGVPASDESSANSIRTMDRGTEIHEIIQDLMEKKYPGFLQEIKLAGHGIKGSCDGLLPVGDGVIASGANEILDMELFQPVYELQEYKSISTSGAKYMRPKPYGKHTPANAASPKPDHVKQARIYYMLLQEQGYLMDGIRIVYVDRDHLTVVYEFEVDPWTPEQEGTFLAEIESLEAHVDEGTMPERMPDDHWLCKGYCDWRSLCKPHLQ